MPGPRTGPGSDPLRVAVVHDKLWQYGGGERVFLAMRDQWTDAALYTSTFDPDLADRLGLGSIRATFLQRAPALETLHHWFLPLYVPAFARLDLSRYDLVVSSSAMFAKSVRPPADVPHLCYCHTPPRFLWDLRESKISELPRPSTVRAAVAAMVPALRRVDRAAARRVTAFAANSSAVAGRIRRFYGRDATVVHPPVAVERYRENFERENYLLVVARLFPYKRVDLAIGAAQRLGVPLKVVGIGPDRERLERLADERVEFLGWVREDDKPRLFGAARALLVPQVEDFGIATAEALAAGTPAIAFRDGGSLDIVEDGVSGAFFDEQSTASLIAAIEAFDPRSLSRNAMRERAARFSRGRFREALGRLAAQVIACDQPPSAAR